ncbi:MAG: tetratricopeptide repeat protein [Bacteroidota bacterium]
MFAQISKTDSLQITKQYEVSVKTYETGLLDSAKVQFLKLVDLLNEKTKANATNLFLQETNVVAKDYLSSILLSTGNTEVAISYADDVLKYYEKNKDSLNIALSLNNIAFMYQTQKMFDKAIENYLNALNNLKNSNSKEAIFYTATIFNNLGLISEYKLSFDSALNYYDKSLAIRKKIDDKRGVSESLNNIGNTYRKLNQIDKALEYLLEALAIKTDIKDLNGVAYTQDNISRIYFTKGDINKAQEYALKSLKIAIKTGNLELLSFAHKTQSANLFALKNYKEAYYHLNQFMICSDSLKNISNKKALYKNQIKSEFEKKEALTKLEQTKKDEIAKKEKEKQNLLLISAVIGLSIVFIFSIFLYKRYRVTQKQKIIIENQKQTVEHQKELVEEKHKEITDSINYAERIQRSFLASKELLDENLKDYFVLFNPKDVVSGDFYWASKLSNGNFALATADSTGHGVPGAIMSLLNITSLEKAIEQNNEPADILNATRKTIIERLKKDGSAEGGKDGMDCSLTIYDFNTNKLFVTAANNPVWIIRGDEAIEIKPDKMPVGKHDRQDIPFMQQTIELQKGDVIYTLTDGFPDQFGGENGKKFMSKKLRELLAKNANLSMTEQKELLQNTFKNWKGNLEQVDDVCIIGIKI